MADSAQVIQAIGGGMGDPAVSEALSAAGSAIKPGHLLEELAAGTVQEHSTAAGNTQRLVALTNLSNGGTIDDAYAVGETVRYGAFASGQEAFLRVAAGAAAIANKAYLQSAGDGTVITLAASAATSQAQRESVVGVALEAVDNSGGGTEVFIKVRLS